MAQELKAITGTFYDAQDKIINFSDYAEVGPTEIVNDQTLPFEICIEPPNQPVARYELQAWGL